MDIMEGNSSSTPCPPQLVSAKTPFLVRPTDPASSPPPTTPLPPLPKLAHVSHNRLRRNRKRTLRSKPPRPPRPENSMLNIKPRTITSPKPYQRKCISALPDRVHLSSLSNERCAKGVRPTRPSTTALQLNSIRLLTPLLLDSTTFRETIWSALPQYLQPLPKQSEDVEVGLYNTQKQVKAWEAYHNWPTNKRTKSTTKSITHTALFVPSGCQMERSHLFQVPGTNNSVLGRRTVPRFEDSECLLEEISGTNGKYQIAHAKRQTFQADEKLYGTKRGILNFRSFTGKTVAVPGVNSNDQFTSVPRLLSISNLEIQDSRNVYRSTQTSKGPHGGAKWGRKKGFLSLPYVHTLHLAGPELVQARSINKIEQQDCRTDKETITLKASKHVHLGPADPESGVGETGELTRGELKLTKWKKILWTVATISLVFVATAGILAGIISRLNGIDQANAM